MPLAPADQAKRAAAARALEMVKDGMTLGLGTGSTAGWFVRLLSERIRETGLDVTGVATSSATVWLAQELGVPLRKLEDVGQIDLTVDGADEIDGKLNLIKGGGAALLQEKIVAAASERMVVIADDSKRVSHLGAFPLPVEIVRFGWTVTRQAVAELLADMDVDGSKVEVRMGKDGPLVTDEGHFILDLHLGRIGDPAGALRVAERDPGGRRARPLHRDGECGGARPPGRLGRGAAARRGAAPVGGRDRGAHAQPGRVRAVAGFDLDLFVIGGGSGGVRAARIAAESGASVGLAEESRYGGTCVIRGCVPKKLMVYASGFSEAFEDAAGYGWSVGEARFDWRRFIAAKDAEIARLEAAYRERLRRAGVVLHDARATVVDAHRVRLAGGAEVSTQLLLVATGGAAGAAGHSRRRAGASPPTRCSSSRPSLAGC